MSREIRAGGAFVEIYLKGKSAFKAGLKGLQSMISGFARGVSLAGSAIQSIGGFLGNLGMRAAEAIGNILNIGSELGSQLNDVSQQSGMSVEALSQLGYAA